MRGSIFMDAAASSTRVIGRKDVHVVFEGSEANTDGNTVRLPALPPLADVAESDADVIRGYRDHETMHLRCTDSSLLDSVASTRSTDPLMHDLIQYCEDIRIENAGIQSYPGMRRTFSATNAEAGEIIKENIAQAGLTPEQAGKVCPPDKALLIALQAEARRQLGIETGFYDEFVKHLDPKITSIVQQFASKMVQLETGVSNGNLDSALSKQHTADSFRLAEQIKQAYVQEFAPPPPRSEDEDDSDASCKGSPSNRPGNGSAGKTKGGQGDGEGGEGSGNGGGKGESAGEDGGQSGGGSAPGNGPDGQGGGSGQQQASGSKPGAQSGGKQGGKTSGQNDAGSGGGVPDVKGDGSDTAGQMGSIFDSDYKQALHKIVEEIEQDAAHQLKLEFGKKAAVWRPFSDNLHVKASIHDLDPQSFPRNAAPQHLIDNFELSRDAIKNKAAMIRRILELELQARFDRVWQPGHKSGRLNSVRMVDAMHGMENVYQKRETGRDIDTLLVMSIDGSGSMSGSRISRCQELAIALAEALERTGADLEVEVWDDQCPRSGQQFGIEAYDKVVARYNESVVSRVNAVAKRVHGADAWTEVSNATGGAVDPHQFFYETRAGLKEYTSLGSLTRRVVKNRRQRMTDPNTRAAMGSIIHLAGGGTPMIDAVTYTLADMMREKHAKKILLLMTDGQPNSALEFDDHAPHLAHMKYLHKVAQQHGIHLIGVGIQADVSKFFSDYISVRSTDAYEKVMKKLASHLREERRGFRRAA